MSEEKLRKLHEWWQALEQDRLPWVEDWIRLAKVFCPLSYRSLETHRANEPQIRKDVLDGAGILAMRNLAAGLHGGLTSPARAWFKLTLADDKLAKRPKVKEWLSSVQQIMQGIYSRSNFYQAIATLYRELGTFGTNFMFAHELISPGRPFGMYFTALTAGEYSLSTDIFGQVDTVARPMELTASQMVGNFGFGRCSETVQRAYEKPSQKLQRFPVVHMVYPRMDRDPNKLNPENKRFASIYFEKGAKDKTLRDSGYDMFPGFGPRWDVRGQDTYGTSPAMDILGDGNMLNSVKYTLFKALNKQVDPPMIIPSELAHADLLPGGLNVVNTRSNRPQVYPAYTIEPDISGTLQLISDIRQQMKEGLYNDLFLLISQSNKTKMTATEVLERQEEKIIMLGPVLERLHYEFFIPLIDLTFFLMVQNFAVPQWPEEVSGMPIKVEFVSLLAQALKLASANTIDRFMTFIGGSAGVLPEMLDVPDADKLADYYADSLGVPITVLNDQEERNMLRQSRAEQQQQAAMMEALPKIAGSARQLSETKGQDGQSAIDALMSGQVQR